MRRSFKIGIIAASVFFFSCSAAFYPSASGESLPSWIKNTALWYGEGSISEDEFINAIKFLIENHIITIKEDTIVSKKLVSNVLIPNGNFDATNKAFYLPLNLEVVEGTTVIWTNEDSVPHTVQSQDEEGKNNNVFNSSLLITGDTFEHTFDRAGVYHYYCSIHPWRVGIITVQGI